ncbi:transglutaminase domain-containing protein [Caminibacter mediatlanticus TB-2]|uniref:Transglutaminase domain-containing protein n=1 Tax=Caminibacter mediatlanticus TB-2 TaxID=391592 RepID=A0ABX5VE67_9BACT|nr:transglutaminase-like domain-containing protein [Caminibacter mediatlanticus]QCT95216.1 transglutaminase domain-containing protein [Caminibacter mediatlanticus TB-2]
MKRRDFLKTSAVLGLVSTMPISLSANENNATRRFNVKYMFNIKYYEKEYPARLWNPMPYNAEYQHVRYLNFDGNYNDYDLNTNNEYDANTFYAEWKKSDMPKIVLMEMIIETKYRTIPIDKIEYFSKQNLPIPKNVKKYLEPTAHIPTGGIIKQLADRITQGKKDRFEKVKAIYYWCVSHTFRDPKVIGCGKGDVNKMVKKQDVEDIYKNGWFGGKCTDLSSLFTALTRAAGVPAREVFGIRLGKSYFSKALGKSNDKGFANITTWQHCRAEYYIPGAGWIPTDPADITKLMLVENLKFDHPKVQKLVKKYLNSWEMNWVGFNHARDFVLYPKPTQYPLNMFGYPYAEVNDEVLNYYVPKSFEYKITSQEL